MNLDLTEHKVHDYWKNLNSGFFSLMESEENNENWTFQNDSGFNNHLISFSKNAQSWKTQKWSRLYEEIITVMAYMSLSQCLYLLKYLDSNFPGLSFHYIMEARHTEDSDEHEILLTRLKKVKKWSYLGEVFTPMRTRLISGLLEDDEEDDDEYDDL